MYLYFITNSDTMTKIKHLMSHGDKFHKLTFLKELPKSEHRFKDRAGLFKCECGNDFILLIYCVSTGMTKACRGCAFPRNGKSGTKLGAVWSTMNRRCHNPNNKNYKNYGARGITVCDEWRTDFNGFYDWSLANGYAVGLEIDRRDNNAGYSPENCRYVTPMVNSRNRRNNVYVEYKGETVILKDYAKLVGVSYKKLHDRISYRGLSLEEAVISLHKKFGVIKAA